MISDTDVSWTRRVRTLPIHAKLMMVSAVVALALIALPQVSWQRDTALQRMNAIRLSLVNLDRMLLSLQRNQDDFTNHPGVRYRTQFKTTYKKFQVLSADLQERFKQINLPTKTLLRFSSHAQDYANLFEHLTHLLINAPPSINGSANVLRDNGIPAKISRTLSAAKVTLARLNDEVDSALLTRTRHLDILMDVLTVLFFTVFILTIILFSRSIVGPIRNVTSIMTRLADGELGVSIPDRTRHDEIGDMLRALRVFKMGAIIRRRTREQLHQAHDELEQRVEERTRELRDEIQERLRTEKELMHAREEADRANHAKSLFLANMSHELRTPLNAVIGYAEILQEDAVEYGHAGMVDDIGKIRTASQHLLGIINEILDLSKIEAGRVDVYGETFSVRELLDTVTDTIQPLITTNGNTLNFDYQDALGTMHSDATRVRQILFNFLSNAAKFTSNGIITLACHRKTRENGDEFVFSVSDTGIGMTTDQLKHVFEPFTQADASTTRKYGGTGLGLTVNREFAHLLGGDIAVESTFGKSSKFIARLPAVIKPQNDKESPQESHIQP